MTLCSLDLILKWRKPNIIEKEGKEIEKEGKKMLCSSLQGADQQLHPACTPMCLGPADGRPPRLRLMRLPSRSSGAPRDAARLGRTRAPANGSRGAPLPPPVQLLSLSEKNGNKIF